MIKRFNSFVYKLLFIVAIFFISINLFSHESSTPLKNGEQKASIFIAPVIGAKASLSPFYNESGYITKMTVSFTTLCYDFSYGGVPITYEYGLFDSLSIGINLSIIDMFLQRALNTENWILYTAPYIRFNVPNSGKRTNFHFVSKCSFSPLFSYPSIDPFQGDGMINLYNTISSSFNVLQINKNNSLFLFFDIKNITTYINDSFEIKGYTKDAFDFPDYSEEQIQNIEFERVIGNNLLFNTGFEIKVSNFNAHFGYYLPLFRYTKYRIALNNFDFDFGNFELNWSFHY